MTKVTLPRTNQTGANEWSDVESNDNAIIEVVNGNIDNENIKASAGIVRSKLASDAKGVQGTWYEPKVIATEQTRESTSFGTLSTADEITGVVLPENGLILLGYTANMKSSVSGAGRAAIFVGSNQLKTDLGGTAPAAQEIGSVGTAFHHIFSTTYGLTTQETGVWTGDVTTGQALSYSSGGASIGGLCAIFAAAGTYAISVQFKASSGSVTAKERKLWAWVLGS